VKCIGVRRRVLTDDVVTLVTTLVMDTGTLMVRVVHSMMISTIIVVVVNRVATKDRRSGKTSKKHSHGIYSIIRC
jgi:hypothetical protein